MKTRRFFALLLIAALLIGVFLIWKLFVDNIPQATILTSVVWTSLGPEGGNISTLAIDPATPATLYVGTESDGVLKSANGGGNWVNTGLANLYVHTLAIDPAASATLYAGTSGGLFKSTDSGREWRAVNISISTNANIYALAIDPAAPALLYAGTGSGVFKSADGGKNWSAINTGLTKANVKVLAIDPTTPATLYAGTGNGVFKSTNGGKSWNAINTGLTVASIYALAIDPATPATLYAGTQDGVFKSTNGGENWSAVNAGLTNALVLSLAIDPAKPSTLFAGTKGGVFKSTNSGENWNAVNTGLTNASVLSLAINPAAPTTLYAGTKGGGVFIMVAPSTLTVSTVGSGSGAVSSAPTGIHCGLDCLETYTYNASITLTATAASGSTFTGWGGVCSGTGSCTIAMTAVQSVTAAFTLRPLSSSGAVIIDGPWTSLPSGAGADLALDQEWSALTLQSDMTQLAFVLQPDPDKTAFPNSVWDMKTHAGRLYLGYGDLYNNRGPVDIVSYNPLNDALRREMLDIPEEQIGSWNTTADGQFYASGQDARESWTFGDVYANDGLGWQKRRTIYKGLHVTGMVDFQGRLYAEYGTDETSPVTYTFALVSHDQGASWTYEPVDQTPIQYSMVEAIDTVYHATGEYLYAIFYMGSSIRKLYRFDGNVWEQVVISDPQGEFSPTKILAFQGQMLVSGYVRNTRTGYWGFAVYTLDGQTQIEETSLRGNYVWWDGCNAHDGRLYCIAQTYDPVPVFNLYRTADLHSWEMLGTVALLPGARPRSIGFAHDRLYLGATNAGWLDNIPGRFELWQTYVYTIENATLHWEAEVPEGTQLSLRIRSTTSYPYVDISKKPWAGPDATENTAFTVSGTALNPLHNGDDTFQVAIYKTPNSSGESPLVKWVTLQTSNGSVTLAVDEGPGLYTTANSTDSAEYQSPVFPLQEPVSSGRLFFEGAAPPSTILRFQVRSASTQDQLTQQQFVGPDGAPTTFYQSNGQVLWAGHNGSLYIQYRALLTSSDPAQSPFLRQVVLAARNDRLDHFSIVLDNSAPWVAGQARPITVTAHLADGRPVPIYGTISLSASNLSRTQTLPLQPAELTLVDGTGTINTSFQQAIPTRLCANLAGVTSCSSALNVQPGAAAAISVTTNLPSPLYSHWSPVGQVGKPFILTLAILDRYHNIVPNYAGTVRCERWRWKPEAQLFPPHTFQPSSNRGRFSSTVSIAESDEWNLACFDEADPRIAGTQTVKIQAGLTQVYLPILAFQH